jgi:hypothetical protein
VEVVVALLLAALLRVGGVGCHRVLAAAAPEDPTEKLPELVIRPGGRPVYAKDRLAASSADLGIQHRH